jgi:hypothetical protein
MSNNDEYMETLETKITSLEKKVEVQEREFFLILEILKDIRMMNSYGKTKDVADEIDALIKKYTE